MSVTLDQIWSSRHEDIINVLRKVKVQPTHDLNYDRLLLIRLYLNTKMLTSGDVATVMSPNFIIDTLYNIKSNILNELSGVIVEYLSPTEAYTYNILIPNPIYVKTMKNITAQQAANTAAQGGWLVGLFILSNKELDWYEVLDNAALGGQIEVIKWLTNRTIVDYNRALRYAAQSGSIPTMEWLAAQGANNWNGALLIAAKSNSIPGMEWLVTRGADDLNGALLEATEGGFIASMKWLGARGANDWLDALDIAEKDGVVSTIAWLEEQHDKYWASMIAYNNSIHIKD